jgi:hypothetical protein
MSAASTQVWFATHITLGKANVTTQLRRHCTAIQSTKQSSKGHTNSVAAQLTMLQACNAHNTQPN